MGKIEGVMIYSLRFNDSASKTSYRTVS